ncbi:unnamed protein product (macronuclear) [Paramecium tetraurelia]|uniref:SPX domain-containing protein n=1 Tax=Paramecium tetraurelia TaxID=5888 RepID=A0DUC5_PARTE|nr:uncharacterized protein GSPATT00020314001 [Paramecium tetraurelia]CAK86642.1 unnamed protein product [Paramecium tetraurelia]|eukprot:XP_001454039.1 hypothetical protein (macronuclear) [Paramecium tetraurelia strain d4-2]
MRFISQNTTPKYEQQQQIVLPNVRGRSNTMQQSKQKNNYNKQLTLNNDHFQNTGNELNSSRLDNIFQMEIMTHKFEQLKVSLSHSTQGDVNKTNVINSQKKKKKQKAQYNESNYRINEYQLFKKKIDDNIQTELRQIQESRQKLMKCVLNTRQRNISLQLYGDDLTPVITNEKVNRQNEKEKNCNYCLKLSRITAFIRVYQEIIHTEVSKRKCLLRFKSLKEESTKQSIQQIMLTQEVFIDDILNIDIIFKYCKIMSSSQQNSKSISIKSDQNSFRNKLRKTRDSKAPNLNNLISLIKDAEISLNYFKEFSEQIVKTQLGMQQNYNMDKLNNNNEEVGIDLFENYKDKIDQNEIQYSYNQFSIANQEIPSQNQYQMDVPTKQ